MSSRSPVVVRVYTSEAQARAAASAIEADGIQVAVMRDDAGGAYPFLHEGRGIRVMVAAEDLPRALEILDSEAGEA